MSKKQSRAAEQYRAWIKTKPCLFCGDSPVDPHHVRTPINAGLGVTPPHFYCLPICRLCHTALHDMGQSLSFEKEFVAPLPVVISLLSEYIEAQDKTTVPF